MKAWKWIALSGAGALLLQAGACATDLAYYVMQAIATQLVSAALTAAAGTAA